MPKIFGAKNLSADEIATTLGYADAATLTAAIDSGGGFTPKYARIARTSTDQTGISGSFAEDFLQYNSEDTDTGGILTISGDDVTLAAAGTYIISQRLYGMGGAYCSLKVNGSALPGVQAFDYSYSNLFWIVITTGANQVLKFRVTSSASISMPYTDGASPGTVNFVEIMRIA